MRRPAKKLSLVSRRRLTLQYQGAPFRMSVNEGKESCRHGKQARSLMEGL